MTVKLLSNTSGLPDIFKTPELGDGERAALARIDDLHRELRYYLATDPKRWFGSVRRVLAARAIQGSNTIEGFNVSVEDAVAAVEGGEPSLSSQDEDWQAVLGYQRAMTYVLQLAHDEHFEYSAQLLRSLHYIMTEHFISEASPGLWRRGSIWVHNDASGDVVYEGPEASEVPALIEALVSALTNDRETPVIVRAAMAHLNLVMIHPFRDGNGRMSRCLQTLVLARDQILTSELSSIEEYLGRHTANYYDILGSVGKDRWSPSGDALPWVRFCLTAHYIQAISVLRRIRESEKMWLGCVDLAAEHHLSPRTVSGLFDAIIGLRVRNSAYRLSVKGAFAEEISMQVATDDLGAMVKAKVLQAHGARRGAFYTMGQPLELIRHNVREGRERIDSSRLYEPIVEGKPTA